MFNGPLVIAVKINTKFSQGYHSVVLHCTKCRIFFKIHCHGLTLFQERILSGAGIICIAFNRRPLQETEKCEVRVSTNGVKFTPKLVKVGQFLQNWRGVNAYRHSIAMS
jgi:hypothetical protein